MLKQKVLTFVKSVKNGVFKLFSVHIAGINRTSHASLIFNQLNHSHRDRHVMAIPSAHTAH